MSAETNDERLDITADIYWAMLPEWVLYAPISANAVRLYGVLARYADKNTRKCHPSRRTLANHMRVSRATVDRALEDLVDIGAVVVSSRKSAKGDYTSNSYLLRFTPPGGGPLVHTRLLTGDDTGVLTGDDQTIVSSEPKPMKGGSSKATTAGEIAAKNWWERQDPKPAGKRAWFALVNACKAVSDRGWTVAQIETALDRIAAVPSVAQLDRELRNPRPETWAERKAREEREELERIEARRKATEAAEAERARKAAEEAAVAVPPPPEFIEAVRRFNRTRPAT